MKTKLLILITGSLTGIITELAGVLIDARYQFIAIAAVVVLDAALGIWKALKQGVFETQKSFKAIYMMVAFCAILATVLTIEKGFPFASFLSEAVILPVILFTLISALKNASIIGLISNETLSRILGKIDKHKE